MSQPPHVTPGQIPMPAPPQGALPAPPPAGPPMPPPPNPQTQNAERDASVSLALGIVGLFFLHIVLGPVAIGFAVRARRNGHRALPGLVLGWISLAIGVLTLIPVVLGLVILATGGL
ncbi:MULTISPECIES: hypothetical protein [Actinomycetes]